MPFKKIYYNYSKNGGKFSKSKNLFKIGRYVYVYDRNTNIIISFFWVKIGSRDILQKAGVFLGITDDTTTQKGENSKGHNMLNLSENNYPEFFLFLMDSANCARFLVEKIYTKIPKYLIL